jgi:hypothetical protein
VSFDVDCSYEYQKPLGSVRVIDPKMVKKWRILHPPCDERQMMCLAIDNRCPMIQHCISM